MAKFLLKKRRAQAEHSLQVVETTHTSEELLELLDNDFEDLQNGWEHDCDECLAETYKVESLGDGACEHLEVYELGTVEGFFDEPEPPLSDDVQNLIAELLTPPDPAVVEAKRAFVEALSGVLKQVKKPYTEQGVLAEKFWEAGFKYADELLGKWEELEYPEGAEDTETTYMAGALKEMWEAVLALHNEKAGDEDPEFQVTGIEFFECCLDEVEEYLEGLAPNWNN